MSDTTKAILASGVVVAGLTALVISRRRTRASLAERGLRRLVGGAAGWISRELQIL